MRSAILYLVLGLVLASCSSKKEKEEPAPPESQRVTHALAGDWSATVALPKYGSVVEVRLYVAGYTDTVGAAAGNQALSERRARAIATWFRNRGFTGAVQYQGFGESVLAEPTADEVDHAANRRALYILAAQTPPISTALPRSAWKAL